MIKEQLNRVQLFLKNPEKNPLDNIISLKAEPNLIQKFNQIQKNLPKGDLFLEKINPLEKGEYQTIAQVKPFDILLSFVFDKNYLIKSFDITDDKTIEFSNDFEILTNSIVLPFHLVDGYMLIEGEINGTQGKFLFDTGTPFNFLINNNIVKLNKTDLAVTGKVGSGQIFDIYLDSLQNVNISNHINLKNLGSIPHSNFSFVEVGITKDFLGFIGYEFFKNFEFQIDYDHQTITLNKIDKNGNTLSPFILKNTLLTTLAFRTPESKQMPKVNLTFGKDTIITKFDTGNQGDIYLNDSLRDQFIQRGILSEMNTDNWYGHASETSSKSYDINQVKYKDINLIPSRNYRYTSSNENQIGFGYQFLKNYISVWNFRKKTIALFKK